VRLVASRSPISRALAWSSARRSRLCSSAYSPAAEKIPHLPHRAAHHPPKRTQRPISAREPPAASRRVLPSPLTATDVRSNGAASPASGRPRGYGAFHSRAPSRYGDVVFARRRADPPDLLLRKDDAAHPVVRVLDGDQRRGRMEQMAVALAGREKLAA
jgi:hypothetical protein